ncbi:MAG TPA: hypothetical protein VK081_05305 [Planctomycetota bacterium]|nr:hypothetical protein [Planctomycetota bacterium]
MSVRCAPAGTAGYDLEVTIDVPEMPKDAVGPAVDPPLRRVIAESASALRWRRVLVQFPGQALIGSAVKDLVGRILAEAKPSKVVVQRGYGDEVVHEAAPPQVRIHTRQEPGVLHVQVDAAEVEAGDFAVLLPPALTAAVAEAAGRHVRVDLGTAGAPDEQARALLRTTFAEAGATRVTVGSDLLYDHDLEALVRTGDSADTASIDVTPADDERDTIAALDLVLRSRAGQWHGKTVLVRFAGRAPRPAEVDRVLALCTPAGPARIELVEGEDVDVLWPRLVQVQRRDDQVVLAVRPGSRDAAAVARAFHREVEAITPRLAGQRVTVDWPADFELDARIEQAMLDALGAHAPASVACTFGGDRREPLLPPPLVTGADPDGTKTLHLDLSCGKPPEIVRVLERRLRPAAQAMHGQRVRVDVHGGALSRTVLRTLRDELAHAGAARVEVVEGGTRDVILPPLLVAEVDANEVRLRTEPGGRNEEQIALALQRELDNLQAPADATWNVQPSALASAVVAALVQRGAKRVVLGGERPVQVHPPLLASERDADRVTVRATPDPDPAVVEAQLDRELPALLTQLGDLAGCTATVVWPGGGDANSGPLGRLVGALAERNAATVLLDEGRGRTRQVFPEVVPDYVAVLGRRDDPQAPLVMLAIDAGAGEQHAARVAGKLEAIASDLDGRRVLLVLRRDGVEQPFAGRDPLLAQVRAFVDARAAATLAFGGRSPAGTPYFEVVHSRVPDLAVRTRFRDPRRK